MSRRPDEKLERRARARRRRIAIGAAAWIAAFAALVALPAGSEHVTEVGRRMVVHALHAPEIRTATFPPGSAVEAGVRIRTTIAGSRELVDAGEVVAVHGGDDVLVASLRIYPEFEPSLGPETVLIAYATSGDVGWVVETLLPPEKLEEIGAIFLRRWESDRDRLVAEISPGLERWAVDFLAAVRRALPALVERRRDDVDVVAEVLRERGWEGGLEEAVLHRLWPKARDRAIPLISEVGDEIIDAFPVWTMSWAYVVQKLPFGGDDRIAARLREFLEEKVVPILARREDDFRALALEIVEEAARDPELHAALGEAADQVLSDPRFRDAVAALLREALLENDEVRELATGLWTRPDLRGPIERFLERMTPDFHRIANAIVLDDDGRRINPELARVLRRKILGDDETWILIHFGTGDGPPPEPIPGASGGTR